MINDIEKEVESKNRSHRYDINRLRSRHGLNYTKFKICLSIVMAICIKQHLSNIWGSVHEKVKQHWGWVEKKRCIQKNACIFFAKTTALNYFRKQVPLQKFDEMYISSKITWRNPKRSFNSRCRSFQMQIKDTCFIDETVRKLWEVFVLKATHT